MLETYFLYTSILVCASAFAFVVQHSKENHMQQIFARILCFMCLFVPAALRYGIGTDFPHYVALYLNNFPPDMQRLEPGFVFLGHLSYRIGLTPQMFMALISGLTYALICFLMPKKYFSCIILFYILSFLYLDSYAMVRQAFAMSIALCAFYSFYKKHKIKGLLLGIVALTMHFSAFILLPIFLISQIKMNIKIRYALILACVFIGTNELFLFWLVDIAAAINPRNMALSLLIVKPELGFGVTYLIFALPATLMLFNARKIMQQENGNFILNANAVYLSVLLMAYSVAIIGRFVPLFFTISLFSIPILYKSNKRYAKIYHLLLVLCFSALFFRYIEYHSFGSSFGIAPYNSIIGRR